MPVLVMLWIASFVLAGSSTSPPNAASFMSSFSESVESAYFTWDDDLEVLEDEAHLHLSFLVGLSLSTYGAMSCSVEEMLLVEEALSIQSYIWNFPSFSSFVVLGVPTSLVGVAEFTCS